MSYRVVIKKKALKYLSNLSARDGKAIYKAIEEMAIDPFSGDVKKLQGGENEYRRRVGKYRLLFTVENDVLTVTIFEAGHRKNIYNKNEIFPFCCRGYFIPALGISLFGECLTRIS